jgi:pilus assembly protein CpaC
MKSVFSQLAIVGAFAVSIPCLAQKPTIQHWETLQNDKALVTVDVTKIGTEYHVTAGQSFDFVNSAGEYAMVYVDNPQILSAHTINPHQVIVGGLAPGRAALVLSDKHGASTSYTIEVDADVAPLKTAVENNFPFDKIHVAAKEDAITITGYVLSKDEYDAVDKIAAGYSKKVINSLRISPSHAREVRLQVKFAEIDRTKAAQAGFNFISLGKNIAMAGTGQSSSFSSPTLGSGSTSSSSSTSSTVTVSNPMQLFLFNQGLNIGGTIENLEQKNILQILAEPSISALSGHRASFLSGGQFPFPMVQPSSSGSSTVTVQFMPYGVMLYFEPVVLDDGTIRLHVAPQVSALDYTNEVQIAGYTIPAIDTRSAETDIELRDGQTFALSGLLDHRITNEFSRMPNIASIPIIGRLFRSKSVQASTTDLVVIVTANIVDPLSLPGPSPELPKTVTPYLDQKKFDSVMPKKEN